MQASLKDLSTDPTSQSFHVCQRVLTQCHEIIFRDLPTPVSSPYATLQVPFQSRFARKKVRPLVQPALVGLAMVLAGAPGLPRLTPIMGQVAVEQGRVVEEGPEISGMERELSQESVTISNTTNDDEEEAQPVSDSPQEEGPVLNDGVAKLSRRTTIVGPSHTTPALPAHLVAKPRLSYDPFGQEDPQPTNSPSHSTPSLFPTRRHRSGAPSQAEALLQRYDQKSQMHLLRSHFCRSEVRSANIERFHELNTQVPGSIFAHSGEHLKPIVNYPQTRPGQRVEGRTYCSQSHASCRSERMLL